MISTTHQKQMNSSMSPRTATRYSTARSATPRPKSTSSPQRPRQQGFRSSFQRSLRSGSGNPPTLSRMR
ncbi:hypothetical protein HSEST_3086 (plasmid) [Halapricum desulfuricans]|uniref:Uncharacterized protein n=1 Tax=Halapricum desulfuricans TaxID=2841257 RepID=A0A897NPA7_9EURY|nr:hypothetical protein HSEST_3086 [Halapricum desulfuricans]